MKVGTWFLQQFRDNNWHVIAMVMFSLLFGLLSGMIITVCCFLRNPRIIRTYYKKVKSSIESEQTNSDNADGPKPSTSIKNVGKKNN